MRWGRDLDIWFVEGRDFRSSNHMPDGPDKTLWGKEQLAWFQKTLAASDATFRVLISPTPILGPDKKGKEKTVDNHVAAKRAYEGDLLRRFIGAQKNTYIICGDRHWQYVSKHPETGLREYSCGPTTDKHATKLKTPDRSRITYVGERGGFLSVTVQRDAGAPRIVFRHHDVQGKVLNEDVLPAVR